MYSKKIITLEDLSDYQLKQFLQKGYANVVDLHMKNSTEDDRYERPDRIQQLGIFYRKLEVDARELGEKVNEVTTPKEEQHQTSVTGKQKTEIQTPEETIQEKVDQANQGIKKSSIRRFLDRFQLKDDIRNQRLQELNEATKSYEELKNETQGSPVEEETKKEEVKKDIPKEEEEERKELFTSYKRFFDEMNIRLPVTLSLKHVTGDWSIRGGSIVTVRIPTFPDSEYKEITIDVLVESVIHTYYSDRNHFMDLEIAKDFVQGDPYAIKKTK